VTLRYNPPATELAKLRRAPERHVPRGDYCYTRAPQRDAGDSFGIDLCPFWDSDDAKPSHENGYCHLLERGDWDAPGIGLLWDQCKECGVNDSGEDGLRG
jgi:hypothetical protein